ncbi:MAG: PspA/IM30 family protein [Lachnospiraceae bacterium]
MGIISRFTEIMKSNINAQLDKCEDPSKMIDQTLRELKENFAEVKKETAGVMAKRKEANRAVQECEEQIRKYSQSQQKMH